MVPARRLLPLVALLAAGCGGGGAGEPSQRAKLPRPTSAGAAVIDGNSCLSCHRVGGAGRSGPGRDLTHVGSRLSAARIERSLVDPPAGMPSFGYLSSRQREDLVAYLRRLR